MNCNQAKKISIIGFLASQGINPVKIKNGTAIYHSPFTKDKTASFFVDYKNERQIQVWKDFSTGYGGNILDLVMRLNNTDIAGALIILQKPELSKTVFSFSQQKVFNNEKSKKIEILKVQPLQNRVLIAYLNSRKISYQKAAGYLQECYYRINGKRYFALAFKNDAGGYELRNKYFKGGTNPKAIRTLKGNENSLNIFEGFFDFLSALEFYKIRKPIGTTIILNSLVHIDNILKILPKYQFINLYLDNDKAGEKAVATIKEKAKNIKDYSKIIYPDYKDFNEFLISNKI